VNAQWVFLDRFRYHKTDRKRCVFLFKRRLFEVKPRQCRFIDRRGNIWMTPEHKFFSDGGSIPFPFTLLLPRTEYMPCYAFHDQACEHGGLICINSRGVKFVAMSRKRIDILLEQMIEAMPNDDLVDSEIVYMGVRIWAWLKKGRRSNDNT